jgi:hypothetical protein
MGGFWPRAYGGKTRPYAGNLLLFFLVLLPPPPASSHSQFTGDMPRAAIYALGNALYSAVLASPRITFDLAFLSDLI